MYDRVAYTYGHAIDKPLSIVRMNYADHPYNQGYHAWVEPFAIVPHWNVRGAAQTGTYASGERQRCKPVDGTTRCVYLDWHAGWFPYSPARPIPEHWHGSLLSEKRDGSGLLYRRNRYYDPSSSRFTQEDPIGLAGGLNVYGFAAGDPVTYSDPYGLRIIIHGNAEYRRRVEAALKYVAGRSETFRETFNALANSEDVTIEIGADFNPGCLQQGVSSCHRRAPFGGQSQIRLTLQDTDLETGFVGAHELFHAAGAHSAKINTRVDSMCGNEHQPAAAHDCTRPLETTTRDELRAWREENERRREQRRGRATNP